MTKLTTYLATYLATNFAEMRPRLSKFSQRCLRVRAERASSHQEGFFSQRLFFGLFSEELLLSASVLFLPVLYMTAALALFSGIGLGRWVFPTGLLLWGIAVVMLHRKERWQRLLATLLLFLAVFAFAVWATRFALDVYADSRAYHAQAILGLLKGINPYLFPTHWETYTYPAAHWLLSASFVLWTQIFTASFAFTPVAALAAFLCARHFLATLPNLSRRWRNVLAFLLATNPITTFCFFAHYVDGLLVSTLLSVFLLMLCFVVGDKAQGRTTQRRTALYIAVLLVLLVNLKFTGLFFGGVLGLTALAYGIRRGASRRTLLQLVGLGSGATILGVALFGFFPYATNIYHYDNPVHPFYPASVFGEEVKKQKQELVFVEEANPVFLGRSQYEKWWISLFSQRGEKWEDSIPLPPFSSINPISYRFGFGSFFSGSILLCLTLVFFVRHRGAWLVLVGVMISVLAFGVGFSVRHAPQNWWLPLLLLTFLLAPDDRKPFLSRAQKVVVFVVVACLLYVSVRSFGPYGLNPNHGARVVRRAERQGGWFIVPDTSKKDWATPIFFDYYKSGLSGVRLPVLSECPEKAEKLIPLRGLLLCRP